MLWGGGSAIEEKSKRNEARKRKLGSVQAKKGKSGKNFWISAL